MPKKYFQPVAARPMPPMARVMVLNHLEPWLRAEVILSWAKTSEGTRV
ncbi:hypothetical protein [Archangium lansingense]|uniref:Uncharacterized protein n=1 Tax=Archangium lansingense TaxID=2995310 RepID=A0ABT4APY6_9BACT|nr:hypothetical protein [Archangium lansinium]MCY1083763.1 hypothetical protein [Archangium lansinium]